MKNQFVTYEIAIKLKEKGFNEPCLGIYYNTDKNPKINMVHQTGQQTGAIDTFSLELCDKRQILAPLYQQVIEWLNTKNICFDILHTTSKYYECSVFTNVGICTDGLISSRIGNRVFACCERNRLDAIKKCIEEALKLI